MFGIENIWAFVLVSLGLIITPGPDILYVLTRGLAEGRSAALAAAAGFSLGNIVHLALITLGISALIAASPALLTGIKIAGALYLVYIAWQIWNSPIVNLKLTDASTDKLTVWPIFRQSVIANLLNPKVILFFLALFPQFINQEEKKAWLGILILGTLFIIMTWIIFSLVGIFAGKLNALLQQRPAVAKWIPRIAAILLFSIAVVLIMN